MSGGLSGPGAWSRPLYQLEAGLALLELLALLVCLALAVAALCSRPAKEGETGQQTLSREYRK